MKNEKLKELLQEMTLKEKIFQLVQIPGRFFLENTEDTGTAVEDSLTPEELHLTGCTLSVYGAKDLRSIQEDCVKNHPHHIPILFMADIIHGYRTIYPMPLAQGAMFDDDLTEKLCAMAAEEMRLGGVHVTFAPMLDLVRDARWGRIMESTGEDPMLNCRLAKATVKGFRAGEDEEPGKQGVASCIKHFAAYGAAEAGRDYTNTEVSEHTLREYYLKSYKAAIDSGADMVMTSFNTLNGMPATGNRWLMKQVLRKEWGFDGVLISDWGAIGEMVNHGVCKDLREAAKLAIENGVDIDMCSLAYARNLEDLVLSGEVDEALVDESCMRVLKLKNKLGLFEDPYRGADAAAEETNILSAEHRALARRAVTESLVLLKNDGGKEKLLPLGKGEKLAFVGPYAQSRELHSMWAIAGREEDCISIRAAAEEAASEEGFAAEFAPGAGMTRREDLATDSQESAIEKVRHGSYEPALAPDAEAEKLLAEAVKAAGRADKVIVCIGEHRRMSGEGASRTDLTIPEPQMKLLESVYAVNKNIVTVVFGGRPLDLRKVCMYSKAVMFAWMPGTEGGHGILDVLTGKCDPSGALSVTMPYCVGQAPICYNHYSTGRAKPYDTEYPIFISAYIDTPTGPLFPFGYGLSYTEFAVSEVKLTTESAVRACGTLTKAEACITNKGEREGTAVVQLYIRDDVSSTIRPVKELKGYQRISLAPGETKKAVFEITEEMLAFVNANNEFAAEAGSFTVYIGLDSDTQNSAKFTLE